VAAISGLDMHKGGWWRGIGKAQMAPQHGIERLIREIMAAQEERQVDIAAQKCHEPMIQRLPERQRDNHRRRKGQLVKLRMTAWLIENRLIAAHRHNVHREGPEPVSNVEPDQAEKETSEQCIVALMHNHGMYET